MRIPHTSVDGLDEGYAEGGRLAGARLSLPDHVSSLPHEGDYLLLHGRGLGITHALEGASHRIRDLKRAERPLLGRVNAGLLGRVNAGLLGRVNAGLLGRVDAGLLGRVDAGLLGRVDAGWFGRVNAGWFGRSGWSAPRGERAWIWRLGSTGRGR